MKKITGILLFLSIFFSSCYVDENYPCYERINYSNYSINKFYSPAQVKVYFSNFCDYSYGYHLLINDPIYGNDYINGTWWRQVSTSFSNSPIITYVDGGNLQPFRYYRCLIVSTSGTISQEFNLSTY